MSCILPKEYKDFLLSVNGGMIDPKLASPSIDVVQTVNGNDWLSESNITVRFLYTLDESTLVQREKNEGAENRFLSALHLPTVNKHYYDAYAPNEEAMGLDSKKLVIIADSDDHYIALSCDDDMYGKVLAIDSGSYPEDYPAGVANTMFNVAILADSFDIFLKSIFYYTK